MTTQYALKTIAAWLLVLISTTTWASHASNELHVDDTPKTTLSGHLNVYRDRSGRMSIEEVANAPSDLFKSIKGGLSEGFTSDAVWVGFTLVNRMQGEPVVKWLEVSQPLLFNASLYRQGLDGHFVEVNGIRNQALPQDKHQHRKSIFELELLNDQPQSFYLRIQSPSSISTELILWEPGEFVSFSAKHRFLWGAAYGAYVLVIIFYAAFAYWTRERIHLIYAVYITVQCMASFYSGAWIFQFYPDANQAWFFRILGLWLSLTPPLAMMFSFMYLDLKEKWLTFSRGVTGIATITAMISIVLVLSGHYVVAMPFLQIVTMTVILLSCLVALIHSAIGNANARMFLFAFSFFYIGASVRLLKNLGVIDPSFLTENGYQIGTFIHVLVMSGTIFSLYSNMRKDKLRAEYKLQDEINLRNQQADFMAMVSHEFRTPLTIIAASSENLLNESSLNTDCRARVQKIIRANHRLTGLMQDYLNHERLLNQASALSIKPMELNATLQQAISHFSDTAQEPIFRPCTRPVLVMADKEMIEMVAYNLLSNAIRYAPGHSPIVQVQENDQWAEFTVFNEGDGIPQQDLAHIFKKFFRGANASGTTGSGLGLYLIKSIVEKHNGQVLARNLTTGGCEFVVRLPRQVNNNIERIT